MFTQDRVVHTELSSTARLPCGSTSGSFPSDASIVYWYKGNDVTDSRTIILYYKFSDSFTRHFNDFSSPKHSCSSDGVLSITDVEPGDQATYTCRAYASPLPFIFRVELIITGKFFLYLFIWGFYVAFNTVQVISRRVVGRAEETST